MLGFRAAKHVSEMPITGIWDSFRCHLWCQLAGTFRKQNQTHLLVFDTRGMLRVIADSILTFLVSGAKTFSLYPL